MSWIEQARADLADAIEALPQFGGVSVLREWVPEIDREKLTQTEVYIAPQARQTRIASRSCRIVAVDVGVAIVSPFIQGQENNQTSAGHELADTIIDGLLGKRIGGTNNMMCIAAEQTVTTSVEHWRDKRMFATFLTLKLET